MQGFLKQYEIAASKTLVFDFITELIDFIESRGIKTELAGLVRLALEELLMNICHHSGLGQGDFVRVQVEWNGDLLCLQLRDHGIAFDPSAAVEPDTSLAHEDRPIGGLGILLIKNTSDDFSYRRRGTENVTEVGWKVVTIKES